MWLSEKTDSLGHILVCPQICFAWSHRNVYMAINQAWAQVLSAKIEDFAVIYTLIGSLGASCVDLDDLSSGYPDSGILDQLPFDGIDDSRVHEDQSLRR